MPFLPGSGIPGERSVHNNGRHGGQGRYQLRRRLVAGRTSNSGNTDRVWAGWQPTASGEKADRRQCSPGRAVSRGNSRGIEGTWRFADAEQECLRRIDSE